MSRLVFGALVALGMFVLPAKATTYHVTTGPMLSSSNTCTGLFGQCAQPFPGTLIVDVTVAHITGSSDGIFNVLSSTIPFSTPIPFWSGNITFEDGEIVDLHLTGHIGHGGFNGFQLSATIDLESSAYFADYTNYNQFALERGAYSYRATYGQTTFVCTFDCPVTTETPIPGALPLFATGLGALGLMTWRRKRRCCHHTLVSLKVPVAA